MPRRYREKIHSAEPIQQEEEEYDWGQVCWKFLKAFVVGHIVGIPLLWIISHHGKSYRYTSAGECIAPPCTRAFWSAGTALTNMVLIFAHRNELTHTHEV